MAVGIFGLSPLSEIMPSSRELGTLQPSQVVLVLFPVLTAGYRWLLGTGVVFAPVSYAHTSQVPPTTTTATTSTTNNTSTIIDPSVMGIG